MSHLAFSSIFERKEDLMWFFKYAKVRFNEKGLYFRDGEFQGFLEKGRWWFLDPLNRVSVRVSSQRGPWLVHPDLDVIAESGELANLATVLDLKDRQRALVWVDGRFERVLGPGLHAIWTAVRDVRAETVDIDGPFFEHGELNAIEKSSGVEQVLEIVRVEQGFAGVCFAEGKHFRTFAPGKYAFWKNAGDVKFFHVDMRESVLDVSGQEIMTSDKVSLRMNAVLNYRIADALKSVSVVSDARLAVYREAQLALRAVVGAYDLDTVLSEKDRIAGDLEESLKKRAGDFGIEVLSMGIRDVILPGDMKELMNRVIEARKAADANLIARREETAAMRSQANTAKLLENNPTLMRMRELDVLEKIAENTKLSVVLGEKGLADRVVNLL